MSRFRIPQEHIGRPIVIAGASNVAPLHGAEYINQFPENTRPLLEKTAELEAKARAITLIYREHLHQTLRPGEAEAKAELLRRTGVGKPCFTLTDSGSTYGVGNIPIPGTVHVWNIHSPQILDNLAVKNHFPEHIIATHAEAVTKHIGLDPQVLVCEIGAGTDTQRISHLHSEVVKKGSTMICHDVSPSLVSAARSKVAIPYIWLPPLPEFLGELLKNEPRRKALTMKNVLSVMSLFDIEEIIKVAKWGNVDDIVVTQSLAHPLKGLMRLETAKRIESMLGQLAFHKAQNLTEKEDVEFLAEMLLHHATQVMHTSIMDIVREYFFNSCQKHGFNHQEISLSSANTELTHDEALPFLESKLGKEFADFFGAGTFNHILFFPSAIQYYQDRNVKNGKLRVTSQQVHYHVSRQKKLKSSYTKELVSSHYPTNGLPIPALVTLGKRRSLLSGMPRFSKDAEREITELINYMGLAMAFDLLGNTAKVEPFTHYTGSKLEEQVYEAFGVSVHT